MSEEVGVRSEELKAPKPGPDEETPAITADRRRNRKIESRNRKTDHIAEARAEALTENKSLVCIVLRVRESGNSKNNCEVEATLTGGRSMADPAGRKRRQQLKAGSARRTLKTAQEKKLISAKKQIKKGLCHISIVLGMWRGQNWQTICRIERSRDHRSSEEERRVDARALVAEEGRDKLRKAMGSRK